MQFWQIFLLVIVAGLLIVLLAVLRREMKKAGAAWASELGGRKPKRGRKKGKNYYCPYCGQKLPKADSRALRALEEGQKSDENILHLPFVVGILFLCLWALPLRADSGNLGLAIGKLNGTIRIIAQVVSEADSVKTKRYELTAATGETKRVYAIQARHDGSSLIIVTDDEQLFDEIKRKGL